MNALLTILISLIFALYTQAQTIEKFSIDSGGASATVGNISLLYTIGEVNIQELSTTTIRVSEGFINANMKIKINPKLFLQGPLLSPGTSGLMNDNLRQNILLPTTSPYADAATCNASVFSITGNNAIVDWVWVELRSANDNTKRINGKSALLQRDGDVVGVDGLSNLIMEAAPTNYYVVVNHRNHLGAMSAATIGLNETTTSIVDFTNSSFSTYGTTAQVVLDSGSKALWAGDVNGNNQVRYLGPSNDSASLKTIVLGAPGNTSGGNYFPYAAYNLGDINLNGVVRYLGPGNDKGILKNIILNHPSNSNSNYYPITEQIPN
ncbi:hemagglutinin protein [Bizionia myxarmorum]|uniref:Hemagglutinin protein n=1 Tax=Bizionia myxarmorum TaxID=291186 RepID=A0A5D0R4C9_9FLAO|nr:hemagglutinin protein [Bizionia myxarmorum]TYB76450.1 hemagglutinin protein [Bizionia myxarmorum]